MLEPVGAGRDEPTPAALVGGEDLVAVKLEEPKAAKDVGGVDWSVDSCAGGARLLVVTGEPPCGRASGGANSAAPLLYLTPLLSHNGLVNAILLPYTAA